MVVGAVDEEAVLHCAVVHAAAHYYSTVLYEYLSQLCQYGDAQCAWTVVESVRERGERGLRLVDGGPQWISLHSGRIVDFSATHSEQSGAGARHPQPAWRQLSCVTLCVLCVLSGALIE